ncbi:MAG: hypothetical protein CGU28_08085 [Candidatus Dactylopiibacterium carminicum]|uniref:DUF2788 domain-containing protein n=1 Tax=Candidatus Dactylopiibacterium carminicum TaxID=857335 RepID=A0A272ESU8_9RHOO|nr:DUF2788 domain-containing protein [Candidatus Dactylopiibacterium carminicum]KAF7599043.1 DUF2788 domain-containing protein [Candidatus Dactylopiibacterium carminicum]PAS93106.1 MAG: hypothetical protein CGU29_09115 [Candidatus Dactylopiibacterium carminicum]PAS96671.1 MAG: hypothetical protein CGU28_08085 [Candidatus Dactylopiibacterium carminicum]PAS99056.1 MAG: hypothetical protein BSR46_09875 [Candidatus Dactylopiibacterium carminicum]
MNTPMILGLTEPEFAELCLKFLLSGLIAYMVFIIWRLATESRAGRYGAFWLFFALGLGMFGFIAKELVIKMLSSQ